VEHVFEVDAPRHRHCVVVKVNEDEKLKGGGAVQQSAQRATMAEEKRDKERTIQYYYAQNTGQLS
jgi:hypothetical protein